MENIGLTAEKYLLTHTFITKYVDNKGANLDDKLNVWLDYCKLAELLKDVSEICNITIHDGLVDIDGHTFKDILDFTFLILK